MENQIISINLVPNLSTPAVVRVSQYDVGRPLVFKVYDGTSPADLTGVTAVIEGTKKSGLGFSESGTVTNNTVTLNTTLAMTQEDGSIPAEIRFSKTGEDVGTANFILSVEKTPHADGTTDGTQETMQNLEGRLQTQIDDLDTRVDVLEAGSEEGSGLTQEEKNLILTLFNKAAYAEDDAKTSYDALEALWRTVYRSITYNLTNCRSSSNITSIENGKGYSTALSVMGGYSITTASVTMGGADVTSQYYHSGSISIPRVTGDVVITAVATKALNSITATYTQSGTVYDTDSLDDLKSDLVVTANYSDSTTETVTDYTLSGTLAEGTSTITVNYGGKIASFNVTVTHAIPMLHDWDFTQSLTDSVGGVTATLAHNSSPYTSDPTRDANGLDFNNWGQCVDLGAVYDRGINIDIFMSDVSIVEYNGHCRLLMYGNSNGTGTGLLIFRNSGTKGWSSYTGAWNNTFGSLTERDAFNTTGEIKLTMKIGTDGVYSLYVDDQLIGTSSGTAPEKNSTNTNLYIGNTGSNTSGANFYNAKIKRVRIYQEV